MADMQPHETASDDVAGYVLGTLDPTEADTFQSHLATCRACRDEVDALRAFPALLDDLPELLDVPADLEARTFAAIEAAAERRTETTRVPSDDNVVPIERARRLRFRVASRVVLSAAAALIIGLTAGTMINRTKSPAPALASFSLASPEPSSAHGTAVVRKASGGVAIDMKVSGLPASPPGTFYTCWLVGDGDTIAHQNRVSVGSFVVHEHETVHVRWTTAADLTKFSNLGITLEPSNGEPRHQGPKVLVGTRR
jgi:anti-sigma-K factor RskA